MRARTDVVHRLRLPLLLLGALMVLLVVVPAARTRAAGRTDLGVQGSQFTVNGSTTFLLGVSYFDARHWRQSDLDELDRQGFNLIRIWVDWRTDGLFSSDGNLSTAGREKLLSLVSAADARGIVVDVAILDTDLQLFARDRAITAVRSVGTALRDQTNIMYDLVNEHDHPGDTFSVSELGTLAENLRSVDGDAIIGASSVGGSIVSDQGVNRSYVSSLLGGTLKSAVLMPHMQRTSDWFSKTDDRVNALKAALRDLGKTAPIYLQEEARRGHSGLNPTRDQFLTAARLARDSGAAGWVFHTDAGFDLDVASFFDSLDSVEREVVRDLPGAVFGAPPAPTATIRPTSPATLTPVPPTGSGLKVEAERYARFYDLTSANVGTATGYGPGPDVFLCASCSNGARIGYFTDTEWLEYDVSVAQSGSYTLVLRVGTQNTSNPVTIAVDGSTVASRVSLPNTSDYDAFADATVVTVNLSAGTRRIRITANSTFQFDVLELRATGGGAPVATATSQPPAASPTPVPPSGSTLKTEAENYQRYQDTESQNIGNSATYTGPGPDVFACSSCSNGNKIGAFSNFNGVPEWLEFDVSVAQSGSYAVLLHYGTRSTGAATQIDVDGGTSSGRVALPTTGDYEVMTTQEVSRLQLAAGAHRIRVTALGPFTFDFIELRRVN